MIKEDLLSEITKLNEAASKPCEYKENRSSQESCINLGGSDCVAFCTRCLAKETLQAICFELEVINISHFQGAVVIAQRAIANLHNLSEDSTTVKSLPYNGWS